MWGWKISCGTEACTVLRKAQEFSKAKASVIQESGDVMDIMVILVFDMARHLLGNNIASLLHTVNIIFSLLSSHVPAISAVVVSNCSSLSQPAEATTAEREGSPAVPAAWQQLCCRRQASWDSLGD